MVYRVSSRLLYFVVASSIACADPVVDAVTGIDQALGDVTHPVSPARHPVFDRVLPGNAFDDYAVARALAKNAGAAGADQVNDVVTRGASRWKAHNPHRLEVGPWTFEHFKVAKMMGASSTLARLAGDSRKSARYELALLRYGQDLAHGTVLDRLIGLTIQRRAAGELGLLVRDSRVSAAERKTISAGLRAIIASQEPLATQIRRGCIMEAELLRRLAKEDAGDDRDVLAAWLHASGRLVKLVSAAPDAWLSNQWTIDILCVAASAPPRGCRMLQELAVKAEEVDHLLLRAAHAVASNE
jgi:hypothetical protein